MVFVKVIYFAEFKGVTGKDTEEFNLTNSKLEELIQLIINKYSSIQELLWDKKSKSIHNNVSIILNNRPVHGPNILTTSLKDGDEVTFLLPVSGG